MASTEPDPAEPDLPARAAAQPARAAAQPAVSAPVPAELVTEPGVPASAVPGIDAPWASRSVGSAVADRLPALASPVFRRFLVAAMVASIGSWMQATAQGWLVLELTNSAEALGIVSALQTVPVLLLSVVAGVMADRLDRRRLLATTQLTAGLLALVLAVLATTGVVAFWHVAVLALLAGTVSAVQTPAYQAIVPTLVDRTAIGSAIALNSAQFNLSRILGPSLAGAVIAAGGLGLAFWSNAGALVLVAAIFLRLRVDPGAALMRVEASMWSNLLDGVRFVRARRTVAVLVLLAGVPALFLLNYLVLLPVYARDVLGIGAPGLGVLSGGIGVGALAGALGLALLRPSGGSGRSLLGGLLVASCSLVVFAVSRSVVVSVAALAVLGACQVLYYATTNTLLQVLVAPRLRGRVMSLYILSSLGLIPIGNIGAGVVAERLSPTLALVGGAIVTAASVILVTLSFPDVRRLDARTAAGIALADAAASRE